MIKSNKKYIAFWVPKMYVHLIPICILVLLGAFTYSMIQTPGELRNGYIQRMREIEEKLVLDQEELKAIQNERLKEAIRSLRDEINHRSLE